MDADVVFVDLDEPLPRSTPPTVNGRMTVVGRWAGVPVTSKLMHSPNISALRTEGVLQVSAADRSRVEALSIGPLDLSVTVAVCTRDRPERLRRCLQSVRVAERACGGGLDLELLVVDNASVDDSTLRAAGDVDARYVREAVPGLDFARNKAVAVARGEVLAFIDDDVIVDRTWLRVLVRAFRSHPGSLAVTGNVLAMRLGERAQFEFESAGGFSHGWEQHTFVPYSRPDFPYSTILGVGCNMAFRHTALISVGPFDTALDTGKPLPGGGDLDILIRVLREGSITYEPSLLVFHEHRTSSSDLRYQYYTWGKSWGAVLYKWYFLVPDDRRVVRKRFATEIKMYLRGFRVGAGGAGIGYRRRYRLLLFGGLLVGVCGSYPRSRRRVRHRQRDHQEPAADVLA